MPHVNVLEAELAAVVVVDVQAKMLSAIGSREPDEIVDRLSRLVRAADVLELPIIHTEQYPEGLGETDATIREVLGTDRQPINKVTCSCWRDAAFREALQATGREHVILVGLETHVCIQQTALDLLKVDYVPYVAADAVGSRRAHDAETALQRMRAAGVEISTTESLIFELIERCDHPCFKDILRLVK